jgi:zinc transport system substrate-binding protein
MKAWIGIWCGLVLGVAPSEAAQITVTFPVLKTWVQEVSGAEHEVHVLMPAGTDPHHFQLKPQNVVQVSRSDVYLSFGTPDEEGIGEKLNTALGQADKIIVRPDEGSAPCFYWLNPQAMKACVAKLEALEKWSPGAIGPRLAALEDRLEQLDDEIRKKLSPYAGKRFYVMHPAFTFLEPYGLKQVAVEKGHQAATPASLVSVFKQMKEDGAGMLLMREGHHQGMRSKIQQLGGVEIVDIELLSENYPALLHRITDAIVADMEQRNE